MAAAYPAALPSFTNPVSTDYLNAPAHATQHGSANDEIVAVATKIGTGASTPTDGTYLKGNGVGTSAWTSFTFEGNIDGWIDPNETWTYASATTFTVSGNVTTKYPVGTKLKLTNTTVKYFYVIKSVYGAPNTTVTVFGGNAYALASAAISSNYYSYQQTPQSFPSSFAYTPASYAASGSMTWTSVTPNLQVRLEGNICFITGNAYGTTGGTASSELHFQVPITGLVGQGGGAGVGRDGAGFNFGVNCYLGSTTMIYIFRPEKPDWGLGVTRGGSISIFYKINP